VELERREKEEGETLLVAPGCHAAPGNGGAFDVQVAKVPHP